MNGCCWTNKGINNVQPSFSPYRTRCDLNALDTELHCYWECPANSQLGLPNIDNSALLAPRAVAESVQYPRLWFRGLLPRSSMIEIHFPFNELYISNIDRVKVGWGSGNYYGDAAGGEYTSYNDLIR